MATNQRIRYDIEAAVTGEGDVNALATQIEGLANTLEGDLKVQALASAAALRSLGEKQGAIENFRNLKTEAGSAADRLQEAQTAAQRLGVQLAASGAPTRQQTGQMERLRDNVRAAKDEMLRQNVALDQSRASLRAVGLSTDSLAQSERNVRTAIAAARAEVQQLAPAYLAAGSAAADAGRKQAQSTATAGAGLRGLGDQLRTIQNIALTALGGSFIGSLAGDVAAVADEYNNLAARIRIVTGEGAAFDSAFQGVQRVALATNSQLEATGTLFTRIAQAGQEIGVGQEAALELTETINKAVQLSGGSAESSNAAIIQLIQGLQSGVLRGEEFNSVMEQSPRLARALADGLGVTIGQLRAMAKEGELTSEVVIRSLQGQSDAVAAEFEKLPPTVGRAIQNLASNWTIYVGEVDKATGASAAAASAINAVAQNLDEIAEFATRAGAVLVAAIAVQAAGAVRAYIVEIVAAQKATSLLALQMSALPKALQIAVAFTGFEVGFQIGDMLLLNSELAKKFGIAAGDVLEQLYNKFIGLKEIVAAVFTDATISEALDNYERRVIETSQRTQRMWEEAEAGPKAIEEGALRAALASQNLGDQAVKTADSQAGASETAIKALSDEAQAVEALGIARRGDADIALSGLNVQRELARQAEEMARLVGDETAIRKAKVQQIQIEIQITEAKVNVARAEAEGSIAVAQAQLAELKTKGELTPVKEAELNLSIRLAQARLAEAEAVGKSGDLLKKQLELMQKNAVATAGAEKTMRSLGTTSEATGKEIVRAMDSSKEAVDGFAAGVQQAAEQVKKLKELQGFAAAGGDLSNVSTEDLQKAQADLLKEGGALSSTEYIKLRNELMGRGGSNSDAEGFTTDKSGGRLEMGGELNTLTGIRNFLLQAGVNEQQAMSIAREFADSKGNVQYFNNPGQIKYGGRESTISEALLKAAERITFGLGETGAAGVGRRVTVEIRSGGRRDEIETDQKGAQKLLRILQDAGLSAGR